MPQAGSDMPYGHLIAATVMTFGVRQGYSLIASFFSILTSASRGPSAIAEVLVARATVDLELRSTMQSLTDHCLPHLASMVDASAATH